MYKKKSLFLAFFGLPKVSRSLGIPKEGARSVKVQKIPATDPSVCFFCPNHIRQILRNPDLAQRCTYRVIQTIQMKLILLCVWAEWAVLGSAKTALKFKYEI